MFVETDPAATNNVSFVINESKDDAELSAQESSRNKPQEKGAVHKSAKRNFDEAEMSSQESDRMRP